MCFSTELRTQAEGKDIKEEGLHSVTALYEPHSGSVTKQIVMCVCSEGTALPTLAPQSVAGGKGYKVRAVYRGIITSSGPKPDV